MLSHQDLENAQRGDKPVGRVRDILQAGQLKSRQRKQEPLQVQTMLRHFRRLEIHDGVVYKRAKIMGKDILQLNEDYRTEAIKGVHDDVGHFAAVSGVRGSTTTPYHPAGNGQVERFNRTLIGMLATLDKEKKEDWSNHIKFLVHAYTCTRHEATGFAPFEIMFGRQPRLPVDWYFGLNEPSEDVTASAYVKDLRDKLQEANRISSENGRKNQQ